MSDYIILPRTKQLAKENNLTIKPAQNPKNSHFILCFGAHLHIIKLQCSLENYARRRSGGPRNLYWENWIKSGVGYFMKVFVFIIIFFLKLIKCKGYS
jgi:hypothetical protein